MNEENSEDSLFAKAKSGAKEADSYTRRDGISDAGLKHFQAAYPTPGEGDTITKEALFYYIYGLLHSPDYRSRYADNLGKELPRIPAVKRFADFQAFSQAGRDLAHWHLNYETVPCYEGVTLDYGSAGLRARSTPPAAKTGNHPSNTASTPTIPGSGSSASATPTTSCGLGGPRSFTAADYRVEKMKFAKTRDPETNKSINDKTTVHYNAHLTIRDIPEEACAYVVNGKPALEWVMERQAVTTDKDSGITNDATSWPPKRWAIRLTHWSCSCGSSRLAWRR